MYSCKVFDKLPVRIPFVETILMDRRNRGWDYILDLLSGMRTTLLPRPGFGMVWEIILCFGTGMG